MNCLINKYEAHGWMITVYQHDYSYGKSKIPKHEADRKKESINRVERRERVQLQSIETEKEREGRERKKRIGERVYKERSKRKEREGKERAEKERVEREKREQAERGHREGEEERQ